MAIVIENTGQQAAEASGTFNFDLGFVPTDGRLLFAAITKRNTDQPIASSSGWTEIEQQGNNNLTSVWYKVAAGESQINTWTCVSATGKWAGGVLELSGQHTTPIDSSGIAFGTSDAPISPDITTLSANTLVISGVGYSNNVAVSINGGYPQQWNVTTSGGSTVVSAGGAAIQSVAGAVGTVAHSAASSGAWVAFNVAVAEDGTPTGPIFTPPAPRSYKVGAVVSEDANDWFAESAGSVGGLDTWAMTGDPAEISIDSVSGLITGTFTGTQGSFTANVTCADDNGPGAGDVDFDVSDYRVVFDGTSRLEDKDGGGYTTASGIKASVFAGNVSGVVTGAADSHFDVGAVTNGLMTLSPIVGGAGDYTVVVTDDDESGGVVPLGSYLMTSE